VVTVRHASAQEVEAAIDVWRAANPGSALVEHPERLRRWSADRGAQLYVADDGSGRVVGAVLSVLGRADDGAGELIPGLRHLTGLAVVPERRRAGVARSLLRVLLDEAAEEGCARVTLWVRADNLPAQRLFASLGFRPTGRREPDDAGAESMHMEVALACARTSSE
jgi:ribosomal protein S18 acetylase RimI-like enzyme